MIIKNIKMVLPGRIIHNGWIEITQDRITKIGEGTTNKTGLNAKNKTLFPGFIDCHTHGGYGVDFDSGTPDAFNLFAKKIAAEGVTKFCQATVTQPDDVVSKTLKVYALWMQNENQKPLKQSKQIGCHIEGPFIDLAKKGAHKETLIKKPDIKLMQKWINDSKKNIRLVTYAPEHDPDGQFAEFLSANQIIPSSGHSNCSSMQFITNGFMHGSNHVTHLFNGMSGVHQHAPGLATAALTNSEVLCELIADGYHVLPEVIELVYQLKKADGICLITDSTLPKGLPDGDYKLGSLDTIKHGMTCVLKDNGSLAGSVATFDHCMRYFREVTGINDLEIAKITSHNIAKQLHLTHLTGAIKVGLLADLVIVDQNYEIVTTIVEGQVAFER